MRVRLTNPRVENLKLGKGAKQQFLWDTDTPSLAVRVTSGSKSFVFQSRLKSIGDIRITIGSVTEWDIDAARMRARKLQSLIDEGHDPREVIAEQTAGEKHKRSQRELAKLEAANQQVIIESAWQEYIEERSKPMGERKPWGARSLKDHLDLASPGGVKRQRSEGYTEAGPLAAIMPLKLASLNQEIVANLMARENKQRPTRAALAYRLLRAFIKWAADNPKYKNLVNLDAVSPSTAKRAVRKPKPKEGDCLQREQLAAWFKSVRELSGHVQSAYLQALLLTGARRNEVMGLQWSDIDFRWKTLTIRDKVEGQRIIPLTPYLSAILGKLPRVNKWVFSANSKDGKLTEPRSAHVRALELAGLPHISIHGLRRSFNTLSEWVEAPVGVVAQIMGHKPSATAEKHYRRRPIDLLRMWHTKIEAWILDQAGIEQPQEDAPLLQVVK